MDLDPVLCKLVKEKIATFDREKILEAIQLTEIFPPPGQEPADVVAQVIHDVALHAESLSDWLLCATLYRRALQYAIDSPRIPIGSWYRLGLCQERLGNLREAMESFRRALAYGEAWPYVTAMVRARLADLLMASEEFEQALPILDAVAHSAMPHPEISREAVELNLSRCLLRLGRVADARSRLESACQQPLQSQTGVKLLQLLADVYEKSADRESAAICYRRIIESALTEPHIRMACAYRMNALHNEGT